MSSMHMVLVKTDQIGSQELLCDVTPSFLQRVQSLFGKPQSKLA